MDDVVSEAHFKILLEQTSKQGLIHYETCSFGQSGYFSKHNTAYWLGKPYLGVGPSAHSFDGQKRSWNVSNNSKYINSIEASILPSESEVLSLENKFNEYVMTGLRTMWGVSLEKVELEFGPAIKEQLLKNAQKALASKLIVVEDRHLKITTNGKFLSDGIASELFLV